MKEMQRWKVIDDDLMRPDEQPHGIVPDEVFLEVVLASDAEAAIAEARHQEAQVHSSTERWSPLSHLQGQRDMLAKCIEAVEAVEGGYSIPLGMSVGAFIDAMRHQFVAALRDLREKP